MDSFKFMKHGSLFSGIGGFDLAAEWMGWENIFHCEVNGFCKKVLNYYWPKAISYDDITKTDFTIHRGAIDILTGGFPCQPYSTAGKRLGKEDDRHLWPQMLRAIREIQPRWVVGENVRGLTNWNGGLVFDEVQADLEAEGYEVLPFLLPACAVNAPHRRDRIWVIAYSDSNGHKSRRFAEDRQAQTESKSESNQREWIWSDFGGISTEETFTNTKSSGLEGTKWMDGTEQFTEHITSDTGSSRLQTNNSLRKSTGKKYPSRVNCEGVSTNPNGRRQSGKEYRKKESGQFTEKGIPNDWQNFPTESPVCGRDDGLPNRLDGITFPKWRNESIKAYGNAVVPQVVFEIFKAIDLYERRKETNKETKEGVG